MGGLSIPKYARFHDTDRLVLAMESSWPAGASTGWHTHPRAQLLHAISGVMVVQSAQGAWVVPPNRALWLVAGVEHTVRMSGHVQIRSVFINAECLGRLPERSGVLNVSPLLRELILAAVAIPPGPVGSERDERLLQLLIDEIRRCDTLSLHLPMPVDPLVRQVCERLLEQPSDPATAAQWAARAGVSAKTLHRRFRGATGMSFAQWREQARLLCALGLLAEGWRIVDIAAECGYGSQSAFTAMFRRHVGVPPSGFCR